MSLVPVAWIDLDMVAFLTAFDPSFWLMMQLGLICGFATIYPMNRLLLRKGVKEPM